MRPIVIGGATGAWGDSSFSTEQLLASERCDFIMYEALAEITMALLTRAKSKDGSLGYATDIVRMITDNLVEIHRQGVRVVTNAGGVNPGAAAEYIREAARGAGLEVRVGVVEGDDLTARRNELGDLVDIDDAIALDPDTLSITAYLGARPIAAAFDAGADIVVTGRCADSALALGPLIHAFGWAVDDYDLLSSGSLAGHLLECSTQSTGGVLTDWEDVDSWEDLGYPMAECHADGSFVLTKPEGTGGLVDRRTVAEQLIYEIGDPRAYILPDVVCDWSEVRLEEVGANRVAVRGARGCAPTPTLKATALHADGFRVAMLLGVAGRRAVEKAERLGAEVLGRVNRVLERQLFAPLRDYDVEVLGAEATYGPQSRARQSREVVLKMAMAHDTHAALAAAVREIPAFGLAVPGVLSGGTGLPRPTPIVRLRSYLVPRELVPVTVTVEGVQVRFDATPGVEFRSAAPPSLTPPRDGGVDHVEVPLAAVAYARSGDKGNHCNIGVVARHPDFLPMLAAQLTPERVREWFAHRMTGSVERFTLPGIAALNFMLYDALGGGGVQSLRFDPQGKGYAQQLLDMPVQLPAEWVGRGELRLDAPPDQATR